MTYLICLVAILMAVVAVQTRWATQRRQLLRGNWSTVLSGVENVDIEGFKAIAECYLQPENDAVRLAPSEMWRIVDGLKGLSRLKANAATMLDLAIYSERWNLAEQPCVSERMRGDLVRLNNAVTKIQLSYFLGFGVLRTTSHVQEAVASYYLIRSRLFGQHANSYFGLIPGLEAAVAS